MQSHVKLLAILHIVFGSLGLIMALGLLLLFGGIASVVGMNAARDEAVVALPILGGIGIFVSAITAIVSAPSILAGVGLLSFKSWARTLTLVLSAIELINIPLGTALGFYGFWVLMSQEGAQLFESRQAPYGYTRG